MKLFLALFLLPFSMGSLSANEILSAEEFERLAEGKTLHFSLGGKPYGAEHFYPGRRTSWQFEGESCVDGVWYQQGAQICFLYEGALEQQCWLFLRKEGTYFARSMTGADGLVLKMTGITPAPLICPGPDVGV